MRPQIENASTWNQIAGLFRLSQGNLLALVKYAAAGVVILESFVAARLLSVEQFGTYSLIIQLASLFSLTGLAGGSGFTHHFYNSNHLVKYREYTFLYTIQILLGLAVLSLVLIFFGFNKYLPSVGFAVLLIPNLLLEPMLRAHRKFVVATAFRFLLAAPSLFVLTATWLSHSTWISSAQRMIFLSASSWALGTILFAVLSLRELHAADVHPFGFPEESLAKSTRFYFKTILANGLPPSIATALTIIYAYMDRIVIDNFYSQRDLGVYSLAIQVVGGAAMYLMTRNYVFGVHVGELYKQKIWGQNLIEAVKKEYRSLLLMGSILYAFMVLGTALLSLFFPKFEGLILIVAIMGIGTLASNIAGAGVPVLHYANRMKIYVASYGILVALGLAGDFWLGHQQVWFVWVVVFSSTLLLVHSIFTYFLIQIQLRKKLS